MIITLQNGTKIVIPAYIKKKTGCTRDIQLQVKQVKIHVKQWIFNLGTIRKIIL